MSVYELFLEDDELFEDDGEADLDELSEDEPEDDLSERRRGRRSRPSRVRPGKTARGKGYSPPRPSSRPVTQMQFQSAMERIGRDVRQNAEALKKVSAQINKNNAKISAENARHDKEISNLKKEMKRQGETSMLLTLLTPTPKLTAVNPTAAVNTAGDVAGAVKISPPDILLPLLLTQGGLGGSGGGDSNNTLLLLAAFGGLGNRS
jgi:hypothetical protein